MERKSTRRARKLRREETKTEKLLWTLLRANQICGLKFRRQHPIGPFFADFVCVKHKLVIEIDGDYHNFVVDNDNSRERYLHENGWEILRCTNDQVVENPEGVGVLIAEHLGLDFDFHKRKATGSGEMAIRSTD